MEIYKFISHTLILMFLLSQCQYALLQSDAKCKEQDAGIQKKFNANNIASKYDFKNDSKNSIQMTWGGKNTGILILVTAEESTSMFGTLVKPSSVYRSTDRGNTFTNITGQFGKRMLIHKSFGVQRHAKDSTIIFLLAYKLNSPSTLLYVTKDSGITWKEVDLSFGLSGPLDFHPDVKKIDHILALDSHDDTLYKTEDCGLTWKKIQDDVKSFSWGDSINGKDIIYSMISSDKGVTTMEELFSKMFGGNINQQVVNNTLHRSLDGGLTWSLSLTDLFTFSARSKYVYSVINQRGKRKMLVSTDDAKTWTHVQLPTIATDEFFSILDIENDMVLLHVDDVSDDVDSRLFEVTL